MNNEELTKEITILKSEVESLKNTISLLYNSTDIPSNVEGAFRTRFKLDTFTPTETSSKGATTESQSVNEAGSASYGVLKNPDLFLQINIGGVIYYIPAFT